MSNLLLDLSKLAGHVQAFTPAVRALGFATPGDLDHFAFNAYARAVQAIPYANRPRGVVIQLAPAGVTGNFAKPADLKQVLLRIQSDVARQFYRVPLDLTGGATLAHRPTAAEQKMMASGAWPAGTAQMISRASQQCIMWATGVGVTIYINGDTYFESPNVVDELPTGMPPSFQSLPWDEGRIAYEFAENELNDTSGTGVWRLPDLHLLRPKPEKMMSTGFGKFLKMRLAGYKHHDDEAHVENEGRSDLSLTLYNGFVYIIEVKWVGRSLVATKELQANATIETALKGKPKGWITEFDDTTFAAGVRQLAKYFKTGKYHRAYLTVFDCCPPKGTRKHDSLPISSADVYPYAPASFVAHRACVDPRKASKSSKAKSP